MAYNNTNTLKKMIRVQEYSTRTKEREELHSYTSMSTLLKICSTSHIARTIAG